MLTKSEQAIQRGIDCEVRYIDDVLLSSLLILHLKKKNPSLPVWHSFIEPRNHECWPSTAVS